MVFYPLLKILAIKMNTAIKTGANFYSKYSKNLTDAAIKQINILLRLLVKK